MENNSKPFFDPYLLNTDYISQNNQHVTSVNSIPSMNELKEAANSIPSATKYYEEQYIYYKYLSQVIDYKTRLFEYEKLTKPAQPQNIRTNISQK